VRETTTVKLVVDHARDPEHGPREGVGSRPALRIVQGGRARPRRWVAPPENAGSLDARETPAETALPVHDLDDVPIYLRPIPAWVPRLW
jgi:hypothetical protein